LQPPAESQNLKDFPDTIEEIADKFIEEILIKNPNGPYALSGHCRGGIIAFEMAKQLKERGKTVHLLAMFDTIIRKVQKRQPKGIKNFYHIPLIIRRLFLKALFKFNFESFLIRKHTKHAVQYKIDSLKKFIDNKRNKKKKALDELEYVGLEIFNESLDLYANACKNYQLKPYDKDIVLFYAKEHYYFMDVKKQVAFKKYHLNNDTKNMWDQFADKIKIHEIDGEHSTMFEATQAHGFAQLLQGYLNDPNSRN
ncbi:MAG TPA: thioesterase domain-containing protein, partial [Chitinophagaceae bacterium]|nr:thioesterase domain-containing protein [Chitinophagaceae bacterium]